MKSANLQRFSISPIKIEKVPKEYAFLERYLSVQRFLRIGCMAIFATSILLLSKFELRSFENEDYSFITLEIEVCVQYYSSCQQRSVSCLSYLISCALMSILLSMCKDKVQRICCVTNWGGGRCIIGGRNRGFPWKTSWILILHNWPTPGSTSFWRTLVWLFEYQFHTGHCSVQFVLIICYSRQYIYAAKYNNIAPGLCQYRLSIILVVRFFYLATLSCIFEA